MPRPSPTSTDGRRTNRRGEATRTHVLDADGLWATTLEHILATAGPTVWARPVWTALDSTYYTARTDLQTNLAGTRAELTREYPRTARALDAIDKTMAEQFAHLDVDRALTGPQHAVAACLTAVAAAPHRRTAKSGASSRGRA